MLPPLTSPEVSPGAHLLQSARQQLDAVRQEVAPHWPGVVPHLSLLAADLAARGGDPRADALLTDAWEGFQGGPKR